MFSSDNLGWLALLVLITAVNGYPGGVPTGACVDMMPGHQVSPQTTSSPYSLTLENGTTTYAQGDTLKVCVTGMAFEGILLQMRAVDGTRPIGSFDATVPSNTKVMKCTSDSDSVSHSNRADKADPTCFVWKAPDNDEGDMKFVAIIAKSKYKFWMNINSDVITAAKLTSVAMTSSTAAKSTSVVMTSTTAAKLTSVVMSSSTAANVASEVSNSSTVSSVVSDVTTPYTTSGNLDNTSDPVQPASNTTGNNDDTNGANAPGLIFTTFGICALLSIVVHVFE